MRYVTYDEAGNLTGGFDQDLLPEHEGNHFEVESISGWPAYRMNADRDGLELAPTGTSQTFIPAQVTMRQARLALLGAGLLASVDAAINALPSPAKEAARIEWDYSSAVERNRGLVLQLGGALGLSSAQLDALFIAAEKL